MKGFIYTGLILTGLLCRAQVVDGSGGYYSDALLISQNSPLFGSTARMQGLAGAQVSLGGDLSVAGVNPAGLGFFNKSVFSFTPSLNFRMADATYMGSTVSNFKNNLSVPNFGMVFHSNSDKEFNNDFKGGSFAITFSKLSDYNSEVFYQGRNTNNSIVDSFVDIANANLEDSYTDFAYEHFLIEQADGYSFEDNGTSIYPTGDFDGYTSLVGINSELKFLPRQSEMITRSGGQNALNFAWGGNYGDKVYFGAGIAFLSVNYRERRVFTEDVYQDATGATDNLLQKVQIKDNLSIKGSGIGFNLGLIARPVEFITLGLSYQSPKFYSLQSTTSFDFITEWNSNYSYFVDNDKGGELVQMGNYLGQSDVILTNYNLRSPEKVSVGATVFMGKIGFITADVEMVDYGKSQLKSSDFSMVQDNQTVNNIYSSVLNYRLGAEFRLSDLRFRAGYALMGDPYTDNQGVNGALNAVTLGAGYRVKNYFVDFALVNQSTSAKYSPYYISENQPYVNYDLHNTSFTGTVGFNF